MKYCTNKNCDQPNPQPLENFCKSSARRDGLNCWCKKCHCDHVKNYQKNNIEKTNNKNREWRKNNPEKRKGAWLREFWPNLTGIQAFEKYNNLIQKQNNMCAICKKYETGKHQNGNIKQLSVDHCHVTGKVRELLCQKCNTILGLSNENVEILMKCIQYLIKHQEEMNNEKESKEVQTG